MKTNFAPYTLSRHKISLIDHLKGLEEINLQLCNESNTRDRTKLKSAQKSQINAVTKLVKFLSDNGTLNENEAKRLKKLDLYSKNFGLKFKIGG